MNHQLFVWSVVLTLARMGSAQPVPDDLSALAAKAGLSGSLLAWCEGEFRPAQRGAYAVAVSASERGGRYMILDADGAVSELAAFSRRADLSCYTPPEADRLNRAIADSETIHGRITPRWTTTVVCGFVDDTAARCWQYSPAEQRFAEVGRWVT